MIPKGKCLWEKAINAAEEEKHSGGLSARPVFTKKEKKPQRKTQRSKTCLL